MKKAVITIVFMLSIFCIASAAADGLTEADFMGTWARVYDSSDGGAVSEVFYLRDDHTVFYMNQRYDSENPGYGRQYVGSWLVHGNCIHIKYGDNAETDVYMSNDGFMLIPLGGDKYITYGKVPVWEENPKSNDENKGVAVYQGEYSVGEDIPEGRYIVDSGGAYYVTIRIYPAKGMSYYYHIGTSEDSNIAVLNLEYGATIRIEGATVYFSPYKIKLFQ